MNEQFMQLKKALLLHLGQRARQHLEAVNFVPLTDTGRGGAEHRWQVEENRRHNARLANAASAAAAPYLSLADQVRSSSEVKSLMEIVLRAVRIQICRQEDLPLREHGFIDSDAVLTRLKPHRSNDGEHLELLLTTYNNLLYLTLR